MLTKIFTVDYDLRQPGRDYSELFRGIFRLDAYACHVLDSSWLIESSLTATEIAAYLSLFVDSNDALRVGEIGPDCASYGLSDVAVNWLIARRPNVVRISHADWAQIASQASTRLAVMSLIA